MLINQPIDCRIDQQRHVLPVHSHQFAVSPGGEGNFFVLGQAGVGINRHVIEIAEWWHRPRFAVGERAFELQLRRDLHCLRPGQRSQPVQVYVEGRLQTRSYEDKEGQKKYFTDVVCDDVILLGSRGDSGGAPSGGDSERAPVSMPRSAQRPPQPAAPAAPAEEFNQGITDDDVPF